MSKWRCGIFIFSGRPNPEWEVNDETGNDFVKYWMNLEKSDNHVELQGRLGYSGCFFELREQKWICYNSLVSKYDNAKLIESKVDNGQKLEKKIMLSIPNKIRTEFSIDSVIENILKNFI